MKLLAAALVGLAVMAPHARFGAGANALLEPRVQNVQKPVPTGTAALSGAVTDDLGRPLRRTNVSINGAGLQRSTITDDDGRFSFPGLPSGRLTVTASKPSYPTMSYGAKRANRPGAGVMLAAGQQVTDIAITLARGAVISGTVFDQYGQPMPGVPVMPWEIRTALSGERTLDGATSSSGRQSIETDNLGQFRFYGLPPGEYTVGTSWYYSGVGGNVRVPTDAEIREAFQAQAARASTAVSRAATSSAGLRPTTATHNYSKVFHPGTIDPMSATTVHLKAGEERSGMDIHMQFRPMSRLEITLSGPEGLPPARISIWRANKVKAMNTGSVSAIPVNGRYELASLSPDRYIVTVQSHASNGRPPMYAAGEVMLVDAEPVTLALALQPAMTVAGRVVFESATGAKPPPMTNVRVSFLGTTSATWASLQPARIDADGTFTRDGVFPASFRIAGALTGPDSADWTMKSVVMGGRDVTDRPVEFRAGDTSPIVITFTDQLSELSGSLLDPSSRPSTDYFVVVLPAHRDYWTTLTRRITSTRPDIQGRYVFRALPPGEYRLAATTDLVNQDLQDVTQLEALAAQSLAVTIGEGEKKVIDIRVAGR